MFRIPISRHLNRIAVPLRSSPNRIYRFSSVASGAGDSLSDPVDAEIKKILTPDEYRKLNGISLIDSNDRSLSKETLALYDPIQTFDHDAISPKLRAVFQNAGFSNPSSIQSQTWPIVIAKKDVIAVARTGSGKTFGYLVPTIQSCFINKPATPAAPAAAPAGRPSRRPRVSPKIMIIAPTRELSLQIFNEAMKFTRPLRLNAEVFYGGVSKVPQINSLDRGVDIAIGTPGRLMDLMAMGNLDPREIKHLVLDEADRMLDMGFEPQIRDIVEKLPDNRQTVFYTATWPTEVVALSKRYLKEPVRIVIGDTDKLNANKNITQHVIVMKPFEKREKLIDILVKLSEHSDDSSKSSDSGSFKKKAVPKTLIFVSTKMNCDNISDFLNSEGFASKSLHGGKTQNVRESIIHQFRRGTANIVVASDVAARGLDIKDIEIVINYDFPADGIESYVHRIGRTGRGDSKGHSVTFLTAADESSSEELVDVLKRSGQEIPAALQSMADQHAKLRNPRPKFSRYGDGGDRGRGGRDGGGGGGGFRSSFRGGRGAGGDREGSGGSRMGKFDDRGERGDRGGRGYSSRRSFDEGSRGGAGGRGRGRQFDVYEEDEGDFSQRRGRSGSRSER